MERVDLLLHEAAAGASKLIVLSAEQATGYQVFHG
jgi:hypothetical protein